MIVDENESSDEPEGSAGDSTEVFDRHSNDQVESVEIEEEFYRKHTDDQMDGEDDGDEEFDSELQDGEISHVVKRVAKKPHVAKKPAKKAKKTAKKAKKTVKKAKKTVKKANKMKVGAADQTSARPEDEEEFDRQHANDQMVSQGESLSEYGISSH